MSRRENEVKALLTQYAEEMTKDSWKQIERNLPVQVFIVTPKKVGTKATVIWPVATSIAGAMVVMVILVGYNQGLFSRILSQNGFGYVDASSNSQNSPSNAGHESATASQSSMIVSMPGTESRPTSVPPVQSNWSSNASNLDSQTHGGGGSAIGIKVYYVFNHRIYSSSQDSAGQFFDAVSGGVGDHLEGYFYGFKGIAPSQSIAVRVAGQDSRPLFAKYDYFMDDSFMWNGNKYLIAEPNSDSQYATGSLLGKVGDHDIYSIQGADSSEKVQIQMIANQLADAIRE